jgi:hypothetical protein
MAKYRSTETHKNLDFESSIARNVRNDTIVTSDNWEIDRLNPEHAYSPIDRVKY